MEARLQIVLLIILINRMKTFLRRLVLVGEGVSVHDTHVVNTVHPYLTEVADRKVSLLLGVFCSHW